MKKSFFLFVALFLCIFLIGCSPLELILGPSGSIEINTDPSGAKIFLNNKDTGYITPHTITNLIKGNYDVTVILDDKSYTETVMVYQDDISNVFKDFLFPRLEKINVLPLWLSIVLSLKNTTAITSVTAYYEDSSNANIPLSICIYDSSNAYATVDDNGIITGISAGITTIIVSYTEEGITKTSNIFVDIRNNSIDIPFGFTPIEPEPEPEPSGNIEILDWHSRLSDPPLYYYVEGILKNIGNKTTDYVKVTIEALDKNDKLVSIDYGYADPYTMLPNQEATFQVMVENKPEIEKFAITISWE